MPRICRIDGCETLSGNRGLCYRHRKQYPELALPKSATAKSMAVLAFIEDVALPFAGDECLFWPFSKTQDGYASGSRVKYGRNVCRGILETQTGENPADKVAAHTCGNGQKGCVNPKHLRWKTVKGNHADMYFHETRAFGEKVAGSKLTLDQARWAWDTRGILTEKVCAAHLGVHKSCVNKIRSGVTWPEVRDPNHSKTMKDRMKGQVFRA